MSGRGFTAMELRQDLVGRLALVVEAYEAAKVAVEELNAATDRNAQASLPYRSNCIEAVFKRWMEDTVQRFARGRQGVGQATIDLDFKWHKYDTGSPYGSDCLGPEEMRAAVNALVEGYDFDGLTVALTEAADGLETKGLEEAAEMLVGEFALRESRWGTPPRRTARHWVFTARIYVSSYGYDYHTLERLGKLKDAMQVAAADGGLDGVGEAMEKIVAQIWEHRGGGLPSRTRLGGGAVEGVIFKEKLELKLSPDAGEGLLAFIALHATSELRSLEAV